MGSYVSGVISPLIWVITIVTLLITPLITTHGPPSGVCCGRVPAKRTFLPGTKTLYRLPDSPQEVWLLVARVVLS